MINQRWIQPIDRVAIALMLALSVAIGVLLWQGDRTAPRVRDFNWQDKQIGVEHDRIILTFTRPMEHTSVEANLKINPPLPGKFSWAGRKLVYTLLSPAPYGTDYQLELQGAIDKFANYRQNENQLKPFTSKFRTRDRGFIYVGAEGEETGRLMLVNLSDRDPKPLPLTPPNLVVTDFKPYPKGDRILFLASEQNSQSKGVLEQKLYSVSTGIKVNSPDEEYVTNEPVGKIKLVLDSKDYQILKFDLSSTGETIVVQRVSRRNTGDFGIWIIKPNAAPKPLEGQPGGDFLITPDGKALAITQGQGLAIVPIEGSQEKPLDFLPKYGTVLDFARDGSAAAMVRFNTDYTRSLFLVTIQGEEKEIDRTNGSVIDAEFDPTGQILYCLMTKLVEGDQYLEQPYITAIDLKTGQIRKLLEFSPNQRQVQMSLSPDGIALLFDQPLTTQQPAGSAANTLRTDDGATIVTSRLWLLPVISDTPTEGTSPEIKAEQLPLPGFRPRWLP